MEYSYSVRQPRIPQGKPVFRQSIRGTVHCGFALRERARILRGVDEIRDLGLIANSRWGRRGYDLCCKVDYDNPRDRIWYMQGIKSWKVHCRKRHQWMLSEDWRMVRTLFDDPCAHPHWRKP